MVDVDKRAARDDIVEVGKAETYLSYTLEVKTSGYRTGYTTKKRQHVKDILERLGSHFRGIHMQRCGSYQGDWACVLSTRDGYYQSIFAYFTASYGSCTGCDTIRRAIRDENLDMAVDYIERCLKQSVILGEDEAVDYFEQKDFDTVWESPDRSEIINFIQEEVAQ